MSNAPDPLSKADIFKITTTEAGEAYKQVITIASAFLGGSLLFIEKIASSPIPWTLTLLAVGWSSLIVTIACMTAIRFYNVEGGHQVLHERWDGAERTEAKARSAQRIGLWSLALGILMIAGFGFLNMTLRLSKTQTGNPMAKKLVPVRPSDVKPATRTFPWSGLRPQPDSNRESASESDQSGGSGGQSSGGASEGSSSEGTSTDGK